jgi:hypothetical protein
MCFIFNLGSISEAGRRLRAPSPALSFNYLGCEPAASPVC